MRLRAITFIKGIIGIIGITGVARKGTLADRFIPSLGAPSTVPMSSVVALTALIAVSLVGCQSTAGGTQTGGVTSSPPTATATATATATPQPACVQLDPGATPFTSLNGVSGLNLPAGAYMNGGAQSGGGAGQYHVTTYTACIPGNEAAIDGASGSTIAQLQTAGWSLNNLFPDPSNNAYLDYCSNSHNCLNTKGSGSPFTFLGFDQYANHPGGYTTFRLQVATVAAPACLNDPQYYSGTPKYTLYYDGSSASPSGPSRNHFQMPPGTRVSTFQGGGTAGSTYVYFCSAGTQASVLSFLKQSMATDGWTISGASASGFSASTGSGPTYTISVDVQNPNNYYLRVFIPM
ncbi:MAG TPA: hypothetical protein VFN78_12320 [Ktedonobacterales bacterium]|nr:hypothetical protein [Ktedonobacterales bacterium]